MQDGHHVECRWQRQQHGAGQLGPGQWAYEHRDGIGRDARAEADEHREVTQAQVLQWSRSRRVTDGLSVYRLKELGDRSKSELPG